MPVFIPASIVVGIFLSTWLKSEAFLIPWIFGCITFSGSINSGFKDLKKALANPLPMIVTLFVLHILVPAVAWIIARTVFGADPLTVAGLVLAFAIPTGVISFVWVSIYRGNIALTLSIILIDTLLAPFLVPFSLYSFVGAKVQLDIAGMMSGLLWMIVLPSLLGMVFHQIAPSRVRFSASATLAPLAKIGLSATCILSSASTATYFRHVDWKLVSIFITALIISCSSYLIGWLIATLFRWRRAEIVSLTYNSGMRNNIAGVALATAYFPAPVAVPVMITILFQQILASFYGQLLRRKYGMNDHAQHAELEPLPNS